MKNLLRKLHIGGNHDDQVDAGRIIEGRSYEGSGSNATPRGSTAGAASAPAASPSPTSASNVSTSPEQKESRASGLTTFLNAVGSAVGRVGQSTSNNSNQVTTGGQVRQRLETSGGSAGDGDPQISKAPSIKKRTPSLGGGDSNQIGLQSLQMLQSEEDYQVQIAMALSVSNSYISPSIANEAEKVQIEVAKRLSLGLSPSSAKNSQADIVSYRYWACNMVDHDEIVPDGFYDVNGVVSESHLAESMPTLSDLTKMPISETSKIEAVLVDRNLDPDLVTLEEKVAEISAGEPGLRKTELAQKIALIVVQHMGGPVGSDTEMLSRWRKANWDVKNTMKNVVLTLGCLTIGLTRHRALLFKVLADRVGLPCQLVKGRHYPGVEEEGAVNIVRVEDDREYIIDLMGAPGALIPPDKPQTAQTGNATDLGSSTDVSPKSAKTEQSYASLGGSSCDSPLGSMHSTRSTPEARDVNKDKEMNLRRGTGETAEAKANILKLEGRHHSEPGELAGLSARPRLHARSPSWTEGMMATAQTAGGRPLKDVFLGVAKEHPQLAQKLHDVLLESGVSPPPDLLAEISPKQLQSQVLDEKKAAEEKKTASEVPPPLPAPPAKKKVALRGRPPAGIPKPSQQVVDEGSNSKDKLQRLNSVEGLGERRPLGGGGLQAIIPSTPAILPLVVVPPAAQEAFVQPGMMRHVPVAAAAAATAAVVASTMVAAAAKVDGDANLEVPMAAAATATAAVVAATSAVAGRRIHSNESSPHGSSEKEKEKEGSGKRRTLSEENERVDRVERAERGGSGGGKPRHSGDKRSNETDASSPANSGGRGGSDVKTGSGGGANSNFGDGLDGEMSIEEERNADGYCGSQQKRIDSVLKDVAEWEIPWEDIIIGERIGLGSYGEVYRGDWHGSEVAVKKFLDQDLSGDALEEFRLEVRIMRRLRHPNVVLFMGAVTRPPHLSIVTEFLPRGSLYRLIHRPNNQLDERRRLRMAFDVAKGMNYLHSSTPLIVHRDLKSPNLLVDKNWVVKVCDFGLSRMKNNTFLSSKSTAGTPEWMAPEMLRNEPSNEKCDVYSFGVILWELATLRQPWAGMNPMQVVGAVGFQHRRLDIPPDMDPQLANIIRECWQNDPNARPSFSQLMAALKPLQRPLVAHQDSQKHGQGQNTTIQSTQQPQVSPQQ